MRLGLTELLLILLIALLAFGPGVSRWMNRWSRQAQAAQRALEGVERARQALEAGMTPDALLTDVEEALSALGELTGRTAKEEIVSRIFSRFCVGK
jgi:tRNA modification GTPase